jgi:hypothetical protein
MKKNVNTGITDVQEYDIPFMVLEIDGVRRAVSVSETGDKLLFNAEFTEFENFTKGEELFVKLADGREYKVLNELYN